MSTLLEIESAVTSLPPTQQRTLLVWLQDKLTPASNLQDAAPEALKVFRQLQTEVGLTAEAASEWKTAVADARR